MAGEVKRLVAALQAAGRRDLLLQAIGVGVMEDLRLEAAKGRLSRLCITKDYRFLLLDYGNKELELQPDGHRGRAAELCRGKRGAARLRGRPCLRLRPDSERRGQAGGANVPA